MRSILALSALLCACCPVLGSEFFQVSDPSGLSAELEFELINPTTLLVRVKNTSTGVPLDFRAADQILTSVSWDFGDLLGSTVEITGGMVVIGPASESVNFDRGVYLAGAVVSGEYGFGNAGGSGQLTNFVTTNVSGATRFDGPNLDGPGSLNGPQGGLVADPILMTLGGLGAIQNEIIATLTLSEPLADLNFLYLNSVQVEFGSDAAFLTGVSIPEPSSMLLLVCASCIGLRRRR